MTHRTLVVVHPFTNVETGGHNSYSLQSQFSMEYLKGLDKLSKKDFEDIIVLGPSFNPDKLVKDLFDHKKDTLTKKLATWLSEFPRFQELDAGDWSTGPSKWIKERDFETLVEITKRTDEFYIAGCNYYGFRGIDYGCVCRGIALTDTAIHASAEYKKEMTFSAKDNIFPKKVFLVKYAITPVQDVDIKALAMNLAMRINGLHCCFDVYDD